MTVEMEVEMKRKEIQGDRPMSPRGGGAGALAGPPALSFRFASTAISSCISTHFDLPMFSKSVPSLFSSFHSALCQHFCIFSQAPRFAKKDQDQKILWK